MVEQYRIKIETKISRCFLDDSISETITEQIKVIRIIASNIIAGILRRNTKQVAR